MAEPRYTAKSRAKRIELQYWKRLHPFRRWKLLLSIAAPLVAAVALLAYAARNDQRIYMSGPVSTAHAMFATQCSECHRPSGSGVVAAGAPAGRAFFLKVSDDGCLRCHDGAVHHDTQAFKPTCASCHVEHKGHAVLARLGDAQCVQCHADLKTDKPTPFATSIRHFASSHPEFAISTKDGETVRRVRLDKTTELRDTAQVKLNHQKHLKVGLKGLEELTKLRGTHGIGKEKQGLQLQCTFCHETDASRAVIQPISYARHCGPACHPLEVDARLPDALAPHDTPPLVHAFLRTTFLESFERCQALPAEPKARSAMPELLAACQTLELVKADAPEAARGAAPAAPAEPAADQPRGRRLGRSGERVEAPAEEPAADQPRGRRLGRAPAAEESPAEDRPRGRRPRGEEAEAPAPAARASALDWTAQQLPGVEKVMFKQKCEFCHTMTFTPEQPPKVAPTAIPARWLPHSVFDHGAHRAVTCVECHKAATSTETTDVLLPSIAVCRTCHRESGGAQTGCVECHDYHDKARERDLNGPFKIQDLTKR